MLYQTLYIIILIIGVIIGSLAILLYFTYEDEDQKLQNFVTKLSENLRAKHKQGGNKANDFTNYIFSRVGEKINYIYGEKVISHRSLAMYFSLSLIFSNALIFLKTDLLYYFTYGYVLFSYYSVKSRIEQQRFYKYEWLVHLLISAPFYFIGSTIWGRKYCMDCIHLHYALIIGVPLFILLNVLFISVLKVVKRANIYIKVMIIILQAGAVGALLFAAIQVARTPGPLSGVMPFLIAMNVPALIIGSILFLSILTTLYFCTIWFMLSRLVSGVHKNKILSKPTLILGLAAVIVSVPLQHWNVKWNVFNAYKEIKLLLP